VLRALAAKFAPGWYSSYGPVPYVMVGALYLPALVLFRITGELGPPTAVYPWGFAHPEWSVGALTVLARLVSVALALTVAWLAVRERWSESTRGRWLVPLLIAGSPAFVFYARTSNVDLYYLGFLALAFHLAPREGGWRMRAAAGAAAALAVCCKEQSAPLAVAALAAAAWRAGRTTGPAAARIAAVAQVAVGALFAYALAWGLPFNAAGWLAHHRFLFEQARYPREFPATPTGFLELGRAAAGQLPVSLGWPILAGAAFALLRPRRWSGLGARALGQLLYAAGFLATIGYVYPRFLLPVMLLALPLAIRGWDEAIERAGRWRPVAVAVLVALAALGGPLLGLAQLGDTRYRATAWLEARRPPPGASPARVQTIGNPRFQARVPKGFELEVLAADTLRRYARGPSADYVLMSSFDRYVVESDTVLRRRWLDRLEGAAGDYRLAADLAPPQWTRTVRGLPFSPVIWVWERRPTASP